MHPRKAGASSGAIAASQNDAAPKLTVSGALEECRSVTSQNDAAPKLGPVLDLVRRDQLPVKTTLHQNVWPLLTTARAISYQSKRRCTKTSYCRGALRPRSVTSQNDAAPKLLRFRARGQDRSVTSQNDAAPKLKFKAAAGKTRSVTSQNDAAPKRCGCGCN